MADAAPIERLIAAFIAEELMGNGEAIVDPDDNLFTGGYVDSVGIMRLIAHLEGAFAMKIPPPDLIPQNFRTVRVMAAYLAAERAPGFAVPLSPAMRGERLPIDLAGRRAWEGGADFYALRHGVARAGVPPPGDGDPPAASRAPSRGRTAATISTPSPFVTEATAAASDTSSKAASTPSTSSSSTRYPRILICRSLRPRKSRLPSSRSRTRSPVRRTPARNPGNGSCTKNAVGVQVRSRPIAAHHGRRSDQQLPHLATRHLVVARIHDQPYRVLPDLPDRDRLGRPRVGWRNVIVGALVHLGWSVYVRESRARPELHQLPEILGRKRLAAEQHPPQRSGVATFDLTVRHELDQGEGHRSTRT